MIFVFTIGSLYWSLYWVSVSYQQRDGVQQCTTPKLTCFGFFWKIYVNKCIFTKNSETRGVGVNSTIWIFNLAIMLHILSRVWIRSWFTSFFCSFWEQTIRFCLCLCLLQVYWTCNSLGPLFSGNVYVYICSIFVVEHDFCSVLLLRIILRGEGEVCHSKRPLSPLERMGQAGGIRRTRLTLAFENILQDEPPSRQAGRYQGSQVPQLPWMSLPVTSM